MRLSLLAQWGFILSKNRPLILLKNIKVIQKLITMFNVMLLFYGSLQV